MTGPRFSAAVVAIVIFTLAAGAGLGWAIAWRLFDAYPMVWL